jgi:hypothetical protein
MHNVAHLLDELGVVLGQLRGQLAVSRHWGRVEAGEKGQGSEKHGRQVSGSICQQHKPESAGNSGDSSYLHITAGT